jgi:hypothetical protein
MDDLKLVFSDEPRPKGFLPPLKPKLKLVKFGEIERKTKFDTVYQYLAYITENYPVGLDYEEE